MEGSSTWSVGTDDGVVIASLPEPMRYTSEARPEWMGRCSTAIRDALRELPIEAGTLFEATLAGDPPPGADLENVLLYNVGIPEAQVHAGVRLRRLPAEESRVVQRYRRVPLGLAPDEEDTVPVAAVQVPITGLVELDTARHVWLAARRAVVATLPPGTLASPRGVDLRAYLVTGVDRKRGSVELIKKLLDGVCAAFHVYAGPNLDEAARRLAVELEQDPAEMTTLLSSPRGALLGPHDFLWLRGERVQVSPADDRIHAAEVTVSGGAETRLDIELRAIA